MRVELAVQKLALQDSLSTVIFMSRLVVVGNSEEICGNFLLWRVDYVGFKDVASASFLENVTFM